MGSPTADGKGMEEEEEDDDDDDDGGGSGVDGVVVVIIVVFAVAIGPVIDDPPCPPLPPLPPPPLGFSALFGTGGGAPPAAFGLSDRLGTGGATIDASLLMVLLTDDRNDAVRESPPVVALDDLLVP